MCFSDFGFNTLMLVMLVVALVLFAALCVGALIMLKSAVDELKSYRSED